MQQNANQLDKQVFEQASQEYLRRLAAIWTSPLSIPRKVRTTNTFACPVRQYYMWSSEWAMDDRQELDRKTRAVIAQNKGKHHSESNPTLYQSPDLGGSGLKETVIQYKVTRIKTAHCTATSKDPNIKVMRTFQNVKEAKKSSSVIQDAETYATRERRCNIGRTHKSTSVTMGEKKTVFKTRSPKYINKPLKRQQVQSKNK